MEETTRAWMTCPFCDDSEEGCCGCDHTGKVLVAEFFQYAEVPNEK